MSDRNNSVCPVELASSLDNRVRRWLQDPRRILAPFVREGMNVLDIGCGPGFFSVELAKMVGSSGRVIAADLQEGMLEKFRAKIRGTGLEGRIRFVKCEQDRINVTDPVDFILAFYVVHEVPDKSSFFRQLHGLLRDHGVCLLVEPKLFHVSRKEFESTTRLAQNAGFEVHEGPHLPVSWSAVLHKAAGSSPESAGKRVGTRKQG